MGKPISIDLRSRVVVAISNGLSCRKAAAHFGVSASSAIRWHNHWRKKGDVRPKAQGGDRKTGRIEAEAGFLLDQIEASPDLTLAELQSLLDERGLPVGIGTLWRFFDRHGVTFKKKRRMRASSSAKM